MKAFYFFLMISSMVNGCDLGAAIAAWHHALQQIGEKKQEAENQEICLNYPYGKAIHFPFASYVSHTENEQTLEQDAEEH